MKKNGLLKYIVLLFSIGLVGVDQLLKWIAQVNLANLPERTLPIIQNVFHLTYVENRGAAFGMLDGKGIFLVVMTSVVIVGAIIFMLIDRIKSPFLMWSLGLIIGGGAGNLIDRLFRSYVIDYLDVRIIHFAVFNFADCCVVIGTILLMVYIVFHEVKSTKKKPDAHE